MMGIRLLVNHNICTPDVIVVMETILMIYLSIVTLSAICDIAISVSTFSFDTVV